MARMVMKPLKVVVFLLLALENTEMSSHVGLLHFSGHRLIFTPLRPLRWPRATSLASGALDSLALDGVHRSHHRSAEASFGLDQPQTAIRSPFDWSHMATMQGKGQFAAHNPRFSGGGSGLAIPARTIRCKSRSR